jgi:hypothetical protein
MSNTVLENITPDEELLQERARMDDKRRDDAAVVQNQAWDMAFKIVDDLVDFAEGVKENFIPKKFILSDEVHVAAEHILEREFRFQAEGYGPMLVDTTSEEVAMLNGQTAAGERRTELVLGAGSMLVWKETTSYDEHDVEIEYKAAHITEPGLV